MILSDKSILEAVDAGDIVIDPFDRKQLGTNSYDVRLASTLAWYPYSILDAKVEHKVIYEEIPEEGLVLVPNRLYLGVTEEYVGSRKYVPWLDGKSSAGRLGISVHVTAGRGDVGFFNHWTMEIFVIQAVRVYAGMPLGQFTFFESAPVAVPYDQKPSAKYHGREKRPRPSAMWKNFTKEASPSLPTGSSYRLMFHDDGCGEPLDSEGECPKCGLSPDMQSTGFKDVPVEEVHAKQAAGATFMGVNRNQIK